MQIIEYFAIYDYCNRHEKCQQGDRFKGIRIEIFSRKKYQSLIIYIKHNAIYLTLSWFYRMRLL